MLLQEAINGLKLNNFFILYVEDKYWIGAKGYKLYKYDVESQEWKYFSRLKEGAMSVFSEFFLTRRFFRAEIRNLYVFRDNTIMCIAKKGIYKYNSRNHIFEKAFHIKRGSRPLNLCQDDKGDIYFGEYFSNYDKEPVHVYYSRDNGENWDIAYTFAQGTINHIHGIFYDNYTQNIWFATGDREGECVIGYTQDSFGTVNIVYKGNQEYRTCKLFFYPDKIVYATDSQYVKNEIKSFDRETKQICVLQDIQGSCIYGVQLGSVSLLSTTVEPSDINKDQRSYLWMSNNGLKWEPVCAFKKDNLPFVLFQFGSIRFPEYNVSNEFSKIIFSGRALKEADGNSFVIDLEKK